MTPERWAQIKEIFGAALEEPEHERAGWLDSACGADGLLRAEVERLLAQDDESLKSPAGALLAQVVPGLAAGDLLSHYRVEAKIGEGGMGVVYKARDTHLDRFVAIKVLPPERVADPERKRRFVLEAKAASALNHPNIVTVHDIDHSDGIDFIAMEYVEGRTLDELIGRKGLKLSEALKYAIQIADALAKAHGAGIVHRDLKPGNVMVTPDGRAKVLDFGLAKLTETAPAASEDPTVTERKSTELGMIVGTAAYMSPEQAAGKKVDARSDIFSFSSLLYEMLTGRRAFRRDAPALTLAAILHMEPPPLEPVIPRDVDKVVMHCLRKDPDRRYQHIGDVKIALEDLKEESESGALEGAAAVGPKRRRRWPWVAGAAAAALLSVGLVWWLRQGAPPEDLRPVPLTSTGRACCPSFSPDGTYVAFAWTGEQDAKSEIYVKQLGAPGAPSKLTTSPVGATLPRWSPDDRWIAYVDGADLVVIPPLGGPERKIAPKPVGAGAPSWTPDGKWIALAQNDSPISFSLWAVAIETKERRRLTTFTTKAGGAEVPLGDSWPSFSPDGRSLAFWRQVNSFIFELCVQPLTRDLRPDGEPRVITDRSYAHVSGVAWTSNGRDLVYSAGAALSLWRVAASGRQAPRRLAYPGSAVQPAIARTPPRLVYSWLVVNNNLWRLDVHTGERKPLISSASPAWAVIEFPQYSPDGRKIAFESDRTGDKEVWTCDADGSNCQQLTKFEGPLGGSPRWSPDSRWIALDSRASGNPEIYVIAADGGAPHRLTHNPKNNVIPSWSHDGSWIYFASDRSGRFEVWKMPRDGGEAIQVTRGGGYAAFESPDGKYLYYTKFNPQGPQEPLFRMPAEGGEEVQVVPRIGYWADFGVTSKGVYFEPPDQNTIQFLDAASGKLSTLATLDKGVAHTLAVSPDDAYVVWPQADREAQNLMLVEGFR
jgi:Tol biopolymer transport system component/tRNA A-37 threonylcarbamoyl transferase component Bud32